MRYLGLTVLSKIIQYPGASRACLVIARIDSLPFYLKGSFKMPLPSRIVSYIGSISFAEYMTGVELRYAAGSHSCEQLILIAAKEALLAPCTAWAI